MTVKRTGESVIIAEIIGNDYIERQYWYYTDKEAIELFKEATMEVRTLCS